MGINIDIAKLPKEIMDRSKATRREVATAVNISAERGRTYIVRKTPKDQGELKASWRVMVAYASATKMSAGKQKLATLVNTAPYAGVVEGGARPHFLPYSARVALYEWVRRHFRYTTKRKDGKQSKPKQVTGDVFDDPVLTEITWGIVHKIANEGTRPTYFVRDSIPKLRKLMHTELGKALRRISKKKAGKR